MKLVHPIALLVGCAILIEDPASASTDCPNSCEDQEASEAKCAASGECSSCSDCTCKAWCERDTTPWETKCDWKDCLGCQECFSSSLAKCKSSCYTDTDPWNTKCTSNDCSKCMECTCKPWCANAIRSWEVKCEWTNCLGCQECSCEPWCARAEKPWELKCTWNDCLGCQDCFSPPAATKKPNILLIFADDVGTGDIPGYWGNENDGLVDMPHLYSLVNKGTVFTDMHSTPLCAPSRYVLLSGNYASRGRLKGGSWNMGEPTQFVGDQKSIAEVLRDDAGYHTAMMGKWHIAGRIPTTASNPRETFSTILTNPLNNWTLPLVEGPQTFGFDSSLMTDKGIQGSPYSFFRDGFLVTPAEDVVFWERGIYEMPFGQSEILGKGEGDINWDSTAYNMILVNETNRFLDEHLATRSEDPFFAYVALGSVHAPHSPPREYIDGTPVAGESETKFLDILRELDLVVGSLVQSIEDRGLADETIIIFTSDNGGLPNHATKSEKIGHFTGGPLRGQKNSIYEGGHRVPFVIRHDGVFSSGEERTHLLGLNDIFATLCEIAGVDVPSGSAVDSISFADYIVSNNNAGLREFLGVWQEDNIARSIRYKNFKLIYHYSTDETTFYDLDSDIGETTDLSSLAEYQDLMQVMEAELDRLLPK